MALRRNLRIPHGENRLIGVGFAAVFLGGGDDCRMAVPLCDVQAVARARWNLALVSAFSADLHFFAACRLDLLN